MKIKHVLIFFLVAIPLSVFIYAIVKIEEPVRHTLTNLLYLANDVLPCTSLQANGACPPGSVRIDPFLKKIQSTQFELQKRIPLDETFFVSSKRSFHTRGDGYGYGDKGYNWALHLLNPVASLKLASHEYSLKDQIRFGARVITLENHVYGDDIVLCHSDFEIPQVNTVMNLLNSQTDQYGSTQNFVCDAMSRRLRDLLLENKQWLDDNPSEFLIYKITEKEKYFASYQNRDLVATIYKDIFGEAAIYTHNLGDPWPTLQFLIDHGKRVVFLCANSVCHDSTMQRKRIMSYMPFSKTTAKRGCFFQDPGYRVIEGNSLTLFTFYYGSIQKGYLDAPYLDRLKDCPLNMVLLDDYNQTLASSMDWTWKEYPLEGCAVLEKTSQRWIASDCSEELPFLCKNSQGLFFTITKGPFSKGAQVCKDSGAVFWAPTNPYEQRVFLRPREVPPRVWVDYQEKNL